MAILLSAAACCQWSLAAEPALIEETDATLLIPPASSRRMLVTQIVPAATTLQHTTTAEYNQPAGQASPVHVVFQVQGQVQSAQPGQTTVPSPSSSVQPTPPSQGAQPGQSTIPSPGSSPPPGTSQPGTLPPAGVPGTAPTQSAAPPVGIGPAFRRPSTVVIPDVRATPQVALPPQQVVVPPQQVVVPPTRSMAPQIDYDPMLQPAPLPDDVDRETPFLDDGDGDVAGRRGVRPYGGGHPTDWPWGCNGSPYRTGPGMCDDWRVGLRWHVTVDGIVMQRDETDLTALEAQLRANDAEGTLAGTPPAVLIPTFEQFDFDPGGRITFTSQVAKYTDWDVQVAWEGIPEWHSSIVYPKLPLDPFALPPPGTPAPPPAPTDVATEQRRFHYTSTLQSGEINFLRGRNPTWRPYCGVRYIKFDDEINDFFDQEAPPGLPAATPITVAFTDRLNLIDIQNNLTGFQLGLLHDTWRVNRRFAIEGFVNGGVYHNRVKFTNLMGTFTTQFIPDDLDTAAVNEARTDSSDTTNNDVREYAEISYVGEASLTGVMRLNKCWALRGGYQALYIANVHLADDAYLGAENMARDLFFHGWHAGIECRR